MKFFFNIFILLITLPTFAQYNTSKQEVSVLPYWEKGDNFEYLQTEKEYQVRNNDTIIKKNKTFDLTINILEKDVDSYTIEWITHIDYTQVPAHLQEDFKTKLGPQKFVYRTNANGVFENLLNFDEIVTYNKNLVEILGTSIQNEKDKEAFKAAFDKVFGNEDVTEQLIASKINTFHLFYGNLIKAKKPTKSKFESVNPVTRNKIVYNRSIELEDYNQEDKVYTLYSETLPTQQNLLGEVKSTLETIISKEVKEMEKIQIFDYISKVFQATHDSGVILYQMKRDFIEVDQQETVKELEFILK